MSHATIAPPRIAPDKALAVAQSDATAAYGNLSLFRIEITLESDGWHIDYVLQDPNRKGGGPHYIIDASTGEIRWKRYEQ
jgi:hypothetical protein